MSGVFLVTGRLRWVVFELLRLACLRADPILDPRADTPLMEGD